MNESSLDCRRILKQIGSAKPNAMARIFGRQEFSQVFGKVEFYDLGIVVAVVCCMKNLPATKTNIFAFHIHEYGVCEGDLASAGAHFGTGEHPNHLGDMPVLFSNGGEAFLVFCTDRFTISEIVGRSVIIHAGPDDFVSQPAGNAGERIACGLVLKN